MTHILIPTCRHYSEIDSMVMRIMSMSADWGNGDMVFASSNIDGSASQNRNHCLDILQDGEIAIMLDDDISGFYPGWDKDLIAPLVNNENARAVSARLLNPDGSVAQTCSRCYNLTPDLIEVFPNHQSVMPTAAIAFRHDKSIRFDENFKGSGFEDGDWLFGHLAKYPVCSFWQSNKCKLIHHNEQKGQRPHWLHNRQYLLRKWKAPGVLR